MPKVTKKTREKAADFRVSIAVHHNAMELMEESKVEAGQRQTTAYKRYRHFVQSEM